MRGRDATLERRRSGRRGPLLWAVAGALFVAACTGDNLFTGPGFANNLLGPSVEITAPQEGLTLAVGDSVEVKANLSSTNGVTVVNYTGHFANGAVAFIGESASLPGPQDTTVANYLRQADGGGTGTVSIVVEAGDATGDRGADTVHVIIG